MLAPILMIFYSYTPRPYKNSLNEFDLQFKIFTLWKYNINSYMFVKSINLIGYAFYETSFKDPIVK